MPYVIGILAVALILYFATNASADCNVTGDELNCNISSDPSTWPNGCSASGNGAVWDVCRAIAIAEGANVAGSNPDVCNNPGDISDGANTYGSQSHSGSQVTTFPSKQVGWQWLYNKIYNAFIMGSSSVYNANMTWTQFAQAYAGNWQAWVNNVTGQLGVSPDDRVGDYFGT